MKTLILVQAHGGTEKIMDLHMPFWKAHPNSHLVVASPESKAVQERSDYQTVSIGANSHSGVSSIDRYVRTWQWALSEMEKQGYGRVCFWDYEASCLTPKFPYHPTLMLATIRMELTHSDLTYRSPLLAAPPYIMSIDVLRKVCRQIASGNYTDEGACFDRYLMWCLIQPSSDVKFASIGRYGYPVNDSGLLAAVAKGAVCIHGIRTHETLDAVMEARKLVNLDYDIMASNNSTMDQ